LPPLPPHYSLRTDTPQNAGKLPPPWAPSGGRFINHHPPCINRRSLVKQLPPWAHLVRRRLRVGPDRAAYARAYAQVTHNVCTREPVFVVRRVTPAYKKTLSNRTQQKGYETPSADYIGGVCQRSLQNAGKLRPAPGPAGGKFINQHAPFINRRSLVSSRPAGAPSGSAREIACS
jgi:hypothetical protein